MFHWQERDYHYAVYMRGDEEVGRIFPSWNSEWHYVMLNGTISDCRTREAAVATVEDLARRHVVSIPPNYNLFYNEVRPLVEKIPNIHFDRDTHHRSFRIWFSDPKDAMK